jgi:hypothetical protein
MWDVIKIVASVVVIILLLQLLDLTEAIKTRLRGGLTRKELENRLGELEKRVGLLEEQIRTKG